MTEITSGFETLTILFGIFSSLAIMVTGFMVGRRWLGAVDGLDDKDESYEEACGRYAREEEEAMGRGDY